MVDNSAASTESELERLRRLVKQKSILNEQLSDRIQFFKSKLELAEETINKYHRIAKSNPVWLRAVESEPRLYLGGQDD